MANIYITLVKNRKPYMQLIIHTANAAFLQFIYSFFFVVVADIQWI